MRLPDAVLRYAEHADALIDLFLPASAPTGSSVPLVVALHGGFWRAAYDRTHLRPLAIALAGAGSVVAVPEYRRVGGAGGWPTTADDVRAALVALPQLLGSLGVATSGLTVVGHSAGGHLALWLAGEALPISRVVGLAPVADLRAAAAGHVGHDAVVDFLGGTPAAVPEAYDAADPASRLAERPACEIVIVHGEDDVEVPVDNSAGLAARFPFVELRRLPGVGHFELVDPESGAWPAVLAAVRGRPVTAH